MSNNKLDVYFQICNLFPDFQYGFRSLCQTEDHLTVAADRIFRTFNMSGVTQTVALDILEI